MATIPIQLKVDENFVDNIKRMARFRSVEQDKDISWQDLVREAIYNSFPVPKEAKNGSKENIS